MMFSRNPFEVLGLDPNGATEKDIKRAYAKKLKTTRPDDDPQGFMALRSALEQAKQEIRWRTYDNNYDDYEDNDQPEDTTQLEPGSPTSEISSEAVATDLPGDDEPWEEIARERAERPDGSPDFVSIFSEGADWADPDETSDTPAEPETLAETSDEDVENDFSDPYDKDIAAVNRTLEQITALLDTPDRHSSWSDWLALLEDESVASLNAFQILSHRLRNEICERTGFTAEATTPNVKSGIAAEVFLELDNHFGWSKQSINNWYESRQNAWIYRLVDAARYKAGKRTKGAWGLPPTRRIEVLPETVAREFSSTGENGSFVGPIIWMILRIVLIGILVAVIGRMLN